MEIVETVTPFLCFFPCHFTFLKTLMSDKWSFHFWSCILKCPSCCKTYFCMKVSFVYSYVQGSLFALAFSVLLKMHIPLPSPGRTLHTVPGKGCLIIVFNVHLHPMHSLCQYYTWFSSALSEHRILLMYFCFYLLFCLLLLQYTLHEDREFVLFPIINTVPGKKCLGIQYTLNNYLLND